MNFAEMFGCDTAETFKDKETAEGFIAGDEIAAKFHQFLIKEFANRSRAFREGVLQGLVESL